MAVGPEQVQEPIQEVVEFVAERQVEELAIIELEVPEPFGATAVVRPIVASIVGQIATSMGLEDIEELAFVGSIRSKIVVGQKPTWHQI